MKKTGLLILLFIFFPAMICTGAEAPKGALWVVSGGDGTTALFWIPKDLVWPAGGWRLEKAVDKKTVVLAEKIDAASDPAAMAALSPEDRDVIQKFRSEMTSGAIPVGEQEIAVTVVGLSAAFNPDFGRALGLRYTDTDAGRSVCTYQLTALNANGTARSVLTSRPVDPKKETPLPQSPPGLVAESSEAGVDISWENPPQNRDVPVLGFALERVDAKGGNVLLTETPMLITESEDPGPVVRFTDTAPPKETQATYRIFSVDMFGRRSRPQASTLFIRDLSALIPPAAVTAAPGKNQVKLSWEPNPSPFTSGYVVERSLLRGSLFEPLTPDGLDARQTTYEDKQLTGGTSYFYRVRSMDPRGNLGHPSLIAVATPENRQAPPRPKNLKADVGRTRVHLSWHRVEFPVAGYKVERLAKGADKWVLLTPRVVPDAMFDDHTGLHTQGEFAYRVIAVALDNQESKPSRKVKAVLLDTVSPNPPRIMDIDGSNGKVVIEFRAAPPETDVTSFLVVRSVSPEDPGLVIGDPLPRKATRFEDTFVAVGKKYWYRMVAVDAVGNRSDLSWARDVMVDNPPIPVPPKPALKVGSDPLRHVKISFERPKADLEVIVQRYVDGEGWRALTGGIKNASDAADLSPPMQSRVKYRLIYRATNGVAGEPSPEAEAVFK